MLRSVVRPNKRIPKSYFEKYMEMHSVKMFKVIGCLEFGRVGWAFGIPLSREVCELAIWEEGEPYKSLWKNWIPLGIPLMELICRSLLMLR